MTPLEQVLAHHCGPLCKPWAHGEVVWLGWGEDEFRQLDNDLTHRRLILSSAKPIRRDAAGPRPDGVPGGCWPWAVHWARSAPAARSATPAGSDVPSKVGAGVGPDQHDADSGHTAQPAGQLNLFTSRPFPCRRGT